MNALSGNVVAAEIEWQHKDDQGNAVGGESGHYMLSKRNGRLLIFVYVPKNGLGRLDMLTER